MVNALIMATARRLRVSSTLNTTAELKPLYSEYLDHLHAQRRTQGLETKLLASLKVDRDLLMTYRLDKARAWYETAPPDSFAGTVRGGSGAF